jgi:FAD:protein FMN transferase
MSTSSRRLFTVLLLFSSLIFLSGSKRPQPIEIHGLTMGTSYHVIYFDSERSDYTAPIDSLLRAVNREISVFDNESIVSKFNRSVKGSTLARNFFREVLEKALRIASETSGAFDPTVMPLVNAWGFGPEKFSSPKPKTIDSIRSFVGADKIILTEDSVVKKDHRVQLDFGGIGQGFGVDLVSNFLRSKGIENFLVELGGEGYAAGRNVQKNSDWRVGIVDPLSSHENQTMTLFLRVRNQAFTTSGNYFNTREVDGKVYGHTIDPQSGYPVENEMLSATVVADDCATADAWATAFMVLGIEQSKKLLGTNKQLKAILQFRSPACGTGLHISTELRDQMIF